MQQGPDRGETAGPSDVEVARTIGSVPGVAEADVTRSAETGRSRLRIRLKPGEDPERVSWAVAATLRERFDIALDPEDIRPRLSDTPTPPDGTDADSASVTAPATGATRPDPGTPLPAPDEAADPRPAPRPHAPAAQTAAAADADSPGAATGGEPAAADADSPEAATGREPAAAGRQAVLARDACTQELDAESAWWRAAIRHLSTRNDGLAISVSATLELDGRPATGQARAAPTTRGMHQGIAEATVRALSELTREPLRAQVDRVTVSDGDPAAVTVVISLLSARGEELLLGGSIVRGDAEHAVMRATLDALNRRVQPELAV